MNRFLLNINNVLGNLLLVKKESQRTKMRRRLKPLQFWKTVQIAHVFSYNQTVQYTAPTVDSKQSRW